jgi:hypothetical protein
MRRAEGVSGGAEVRDRGGRILTAAPWRRPAHDVPAMAKATTTAAVAAAAMTMVRVGGFMVPE